MAMPPTQCEVCKDLETIPEGGISRIKLTENLFEHTVGDVKKNKKELIEEFCKFINACINAGSGVAFVHTDHPYLLGLFKEVVGAKLSSLISDNSCYTDNFEIIFVDEKHVSFRVKPLQTRPLSFLSLNTKLSVDKGVDEPTHGQFFELLRSSDFCQEEGAATPVRKRRLNFKEDNKLDFEEILESDDAETVNVVFQEGVGIEAKSLVGLGFPKTPGQRVDALFTYMWVSCGLPRYISAFSKLVAGGSVYFGVREEKRNNESKRKWCIQEKTDKLSKRINVMDKTLSVWKNQNPNQTNVFLVAKDNEVRAETAAPEQKTGKFLYEKELSLTKDEQDTLREKICDAASKLYKYTPKTPRGQQKEEARVRKSATGSTSQTSTQEESNITQASKKELVQVVFHSIQSSRRPSYIVEVAIARFPGLIFSGTDGPESYIMQDNKPVLIPGEQSIVKFKRRRMESV